MRGKFELGPTEQMSAGRQGARSADTGAA